MTYWMEWGTYLPLIHFLIQWMEWVVGRVEMSIDEHNMFFTAMHKYAKVCKGKVDGVPLGVSSVDPLWGCVFA